MSFTNYKDSQNDVLTTIAPVIDTFLLRLKEEMPNTAFVYDAELSYDTSLKNLRDDEYYNDDADVQSPILSFRRTLLRNVEDKSSGRRLPYQRVVNRSDDYDNNPSILASCMGLFQIEFVYYTKSIEMCEKFEIAHAAQRGISGIRKLNVVLDGDLGNLEYILKHEPLSELTINSQGNYYKAIGGVINIQGIYLLFESKGSIIRSISSRVNSFIEAPKDGNNLDTININS